LSYGVVLQLIDITFIAFSIAKPISFPSIYNSMLSIPFYGVPENNLGDLTKLTIISPPLVSNLPS